MSDRTTLRWTGRWAREHGVPAVMISHESLTALMRLAVPGLDLPGLTRWGPALAMADAINRRTVRAYQRVICTTAWAAAEFERIGAGNLARRSRDLVPALLALAIREWLTADDDTAGREDVPDRELVPVPESVIQNRLVSTGRLSPCERPVHVGTARTTP